MTLILEEFREIGAAPACFDSLFDTAEEESVFLSREWFSLLVAYGIDAPAEVCFLGVRDAKNTPLVVLPMLRTDSGVSALSNYYSLRFSLLANPGVPPERHAAALDVVAAALADRGPAKIQLAPFDVEEPLIAPLATALSKVGYATDFYRAATRRYADTAGLVPDTYYDNLSSRLRNTIARRTGSGDHQHEFRLFSTLDEVSEGTAHFVSVYQQSWKPLEPNPAFMPGFAALCAQRGALRLGVWFVDGQPAASQFWIVEQGRASIYKLAHDENYSAYSVGSALTLRMFQTVLSTDCPDRIDFGLGDEPYKKAWTPQAEQLVGLVAFNKRSLSGRWQHLRHAAGQLIKRRQSISVT